MRTRYPIGPLVMICILAGCPRGFDPVAAPNVKSPDPAANEQFGRATRLFDGGSLSQADQAFLRFVEAHPADPLAPQAGVYRGRIALRQRKLKQAKLLLTGPAGRPPQDEIGLQARYFFGLVLVRLGDHAAGRKLLEPYLGLVQGERLPAVLVTLAHACSALKDHPAAARHLARLHGVTDRPVERAHARQRLARVVQSQLTAQQARALLATADSDSLLAALLGRRLAVAAQAAGDHKLAAQLLEQTASARARHQVPGIQGGAVKVYSNLVGLLVPQGGRYRMAGQQLMAGALEGAGAFAGGGAAVMTLVVRDSSRDVAGAARELIEKRGVIALVGTLNPASSRAVTAVAASAGVPFISLSGAAAGEQPGGGTFRIFPTSRRRAQALARHATGKLGLKRLATLAPRTPYGDRMARAFAAAVKAQGAKIVARQHYARGATSFKAQAAALARARFDGLFVPDTARRLALVGPALAKAGLWSGKPRVTGKRPKDARRTFQLLATSEGLSARTLSSAGRYLEHAVLAPGYSPLAPGGSCAGVAQRFAGAHGRPPTLVEAFAHDSVLAVRDHVGRSIRERATLVSALRGQAGTLPAGLTGKISFAADGTRANKPLLYRVEQRKLVLVLEQ